MKPIKPYHRDHVTVRGVPVSECVQKENVQTIADAQMSKLRKDLRSYGAMQVSTEKIARLNNMTKMRLDELMHNDPSLRSDYDSARISGELEIVTLTWEQARKGDPHCLKALQHKYLDYDKETVEPAEINRFKKRFNEDQLKDIMRYASEIETQYNQKRSA